MIPTAGIAHGGTQYVHAMSVRGWHGPGRWTTNYAALWSSADGGASWQPTGVRWTPHHWGRPDGSRFQVGVFARDGDDVLLFGRTVRACARRAVGRSADVVVLRRRRVGAVPRGGPIP